MTIKTSPRWLPTSPRWLPKEYSNDFYHIEKRLSQVSATCLFAPIGGALKTLFGLGQIFYGIFMATSYQIEALYSRLTQLFFIIKGYNQPKNFHKAKANSKEDLRDQCLTIVVNGGGNTLMGTLEMMPGVALARILTSKSKTDENFAIIHYKSSAVFFN